MRSDEFFMRQALRLARKAIGQTSPNPAVGALLVKNGAVIGRGYHRRAGLAHAEVEALRDAGAQARGATLYVTLEPCNHAGRTPPCCDAILASGIRRVVAAVKDPNPITRGRGLNRLKRCGVKIAVGVLEEEARQLNAPFFKVMTTGLPFVLVKVAQSLDGKIATRFGESRWITSTDSRKLVHRWRAQADGILVGINTLLRDDPRLTARIAGSRRKDKPVKIILDTHLQIPPAARCLSKESPPPTWIVTCKNPHSARAAKILARGAELVPARIDSQGRIALRPLFRSLARRGIQSLIVEGGSEVIASVLKEDLADRAAFFIAPKIIAGREAPGAVGGTGASRLAHAVLLKNRLARFVGPDLLVEGDVV